MIIRPYLSQNRTRCQRKVLPAHKFPKWGIMQPGHQGAADHHNGGANRRGGIKIKLNLCVWGTWTHVVIGGFEMDRCEAVAQDEVVF